MGNQCSVVVIVTHDAMLLLFADVGGIILGPLGSFSLCSVCFSLAPGSWYLDFFRILLERFGMIGCWVVVNLF